MTSNIEQQLEWRTKELFMLREKAISTIEQYQSHMKLQNQEAKTMIQDAKDLLKEALSLVRGIGFFNYGKKADEAYDLLSKSIAQLEIQDYTIPEFEGLAEPVEYGNLDQTIEQLEKEATPARHGMRTTHKTLYSNEKTGTVVYHVFTDNHAIVAEQGFGECIIWAYFLAGNNNGYAASDCYVHSEANFSIGKIREDKNKIVIPRSGTFTTHWEIEVEVSDLVFDKSEFKSYELRTASK